MIVVKKRLRAILNGAVASLTIGGQDAKIRIKLIVHTLNENNSQTAYPNLIFRQPGVTDIFVPCGVIVANAVAVHCVGSPRCGPVYLATPQSAVGVYGVAGATSGAALMYSLPDMEFESAVTIIGFGSTADSIEVRDMMVEYEEERIVRRPPL